MEEYYKKLLIFKNMPKGKEAIIEQMNKYNNLNKKNIIKISYLNDNKSKIQIFSKKFTKINSQSKFRLIINNKEYKFEDKYIKKLETNEIKFISLENIINLDSMFEDCKSLINVNKMKINTKNVKSMNVIH